MSLQSGHLVPLEDEAADAAVELAGEQQFDHGRFDVLLLVLVDVERVLQLLRDVVCNRETAMLWYHSSPKITGDCQWNSCFVWGLFWILLFR